MRRMKQEKRKNMTWKVVFCLCLAAMAAAFTGCQNQEEQQAAEGVSIVQPIKEKISSDAGESDSQPALAATQTTEATTMQTAEAEQAESSDINLQTAYPHEGGLYFVTDSYDAQAHTVTGKLESPIIIAKADYEGLTYGDGITVEGKDYILFKPSYDNGAMFSLIDKADYAQYGADNDDMYDMSMAAYDANKWIKNADADAAKLYASDQYQDGSLILLYPESSVPQCNVLADNLTLQFTPDTFLTIPAEGAMFQQISMEDMFAGKIQNSFFDGAVKPDVYNAKIETNGTVLTSYQMMFQP